MHLNRLTQRNIASLQLSLSTVFRLLLFAVIALGFLLRTFHLLFVPVELPYHSGGLFAEFSHQIAANEFRLPERIPYYSEGGIPFAYPPLPFYVLAILAKLLPLSAIELINLLPPVIALVGVIAFYRLALDFGLSRRAALGALTFFAILPSAYKEVLYGGGLAESFGLLAIIWFAATFRTFAYQRTLRSTAITGISGGFCILASPGSAYGAAISGIVFSVFSFANAPSRERLRTASYLGGIALVSGAVAAPYLLPVIANHGLSVFVQAVSNQYVDSPLYVLIDSMDALLKFRVSEAGYYAWFWDALILMSVVYSLLKANDWLLPTWFLTLLLIPREGIWLTSVPVALMSGRFMLCKAVPLVKRAVDSTLFGTRNTIRKLCILGLLVYFALQGIFLLWAHPGWIHALSIGWEQAPTTSDTVHALEWGRENLPQDARIVVVYSESVEDWTPHIVRRTVINMVYGTEWKPDERRRALALNEALYSCEDVRCAMVTTRAAGIDSRAVYYFLNSHYLHAWTQDSIDPSPKIEITFANKDAAFVRIG